jgi:hypothetical protein
VAVESIPLVAIGDTEPAISGLIAHFLAVSADVMSTDRKLDFRVGVFAPFSTNDSVHIAAIGEPPRFEILDANCSAEAFVTYSGDATSFIGRLARDRGKPLFRLSEFMDGEETSPVAIADACIALARHLCEVLAPLPRGGLGALNQIRH